ncbi:MAG: lysine 2,3-aminomutase, partial [Melioribacteraceae bacterium]|nr:lysine 2,3-aminomutase [Melioribacteraceae bacterium]
MISPRKLKFYGIRDLNNIPQLQKLSDEERFEIDVVSHVLPFRTNNYVIEELIDWDNAPDDPIFQLNFMQKGMLLDEHYERMADVIRSDATREEIIKTANEIRLALNPHPAGQMTANVPIFNG